MLRANQRRQFGKQKLRDGQQIALPLHHAGEFRDVGLEPVLLVVLARRCRKVDDHFVDVVFERRDFALRFHRDRPRQIAFGHGRRHFGDRAHLSRQIRRQLIHVVRQIAPDTGRARHARLAAQLAFDTDFARHRGHLIGERRQRVDHSVDRVGQFGDFALGFENQLALQIAVRHRRHHFRDAAHLRGEVGRHEVDVVGQIFPGAGDAFHFAWPPSFPSVPTSRATRVTSLANELS